MPDSPTACTDRTLLRRGWPAGFLAVPGLATVGGWRCLGPQPVNVEGHRWCAPDGSVHGFLDCQDGGGMEPVSRALRAARDGGDLLPLVDPGDVGSWAILLRDLAAALAQARSTPEHPHPLLTVARLPWVGLAWQQWEDTPAPPGMTTWTLTVHDKGGRNPLDVDLPADVTDAASDGPARALVLARIAVRERTGR